MAYTFEEIMKYHPDNINVYQEIKKFLPKLIPFVGAGLTKFAYYSWPTALSKLADKLADKENIRKVNNLIQAGLYFDAAQLLEELRSPMNLAHDIANVFSPDRLKQKQGKLPNEAIYLLPYLFHELVLTTNFDQTLEKVYSENGYSFHSVFLPGHPELLRQFIREGGSRGLLKLHGSVTGELIEYEKIVFTLSQYNYHYGEGSALTKELKTCLKSRMLLFLGCSLENDRTIDLLQTVIEPGDNYYTIISCEKSKRDEKIKNLGKKHIRAILYEKDRHEAVRVILEHLLEEIDPAVYRSLSVHYGALKSFDFLGRFSYRAEIVPFVGRNQELSQLKNFLTDCDVAFRWWAIVGPGGCGKSRLAYELKKQMSLDWTVYYLSSSDYENLYLLTEKLTQKTLIIADYVQENAKKLGKWMEQLNTQKRSLPIRILLIERQVNNKESKVTWTKQLYSDVYHERHLKNACYRNNYLALKPLSDNALLSIIENYALALKRGRENADILPYIDKKLLLQKLKSVDPELCRPLYAMFLTDAYMEGKDPLKWNCEDIYGYIILREQKKLKANIQQIVGMVDEKLCAICIYFQSIATVLQGVSIKTLKNICPEQWNIIERKSDLFVSPADMLRKIGLVIHDEIVAIQPDLIGEYFVYDWMFKHPSAIQYFLGVIWKKPGATTVFFERLFYDYGYLLNDSPEQWKMILPDNLRLSKNAILFYVSLVSSAIYYCNVDNECIRQQNLLKNYFDNNSQEPLLLNVFVNGLVNFSAKQDNHSILNTIENLRQLTYQYPQNLEILLAFTDGMVNLISKQDEYNAQQTVAQLKEFIAKNTGNDPRFAISFAEGLLNLSNKQDKWGRKSTVENLRQLISEYPNESKIRVKYAQGLFNLINLQDELECRESIMYLKKLADENLDLPEIMILYAKSLFNLSNRQNVQDGEDTIVNLEKLAGEYPNQTEIMIIFAEGLFNLSRRQDIWKRGESIEKLRQISAEHYDEPLVVVEYAKGLVNLTANQNEFEIKESVKKLQQLVLKYPYESELIVLLATSLFNLSNMQDEKNAYETVNRLQMLTQEYSNLQDLLILLAKSLFNLFLKQDEVDKDKTIKCLERLASEHQDIPEIVTEYAKSLSDLSVDQNESETCETIKKLERLAILYPNEVEISVMLAQGLFNWSCKQSKQDSSRTILYLEQTLLKYPEEPRIAIEYANGLFNLSINGNEQEMWRIVGCLRQLVSQFTYVSEIAVVLAKALYNLSIIQDEWGMKKIVNYFEELIIQFTDEPIILIVFSYVLYNLSCVQQELDAQKTLNRLNELIFEYSDILGTFESFL